MAGALHYIGGESGAKAHHGAPCHYPSQTTGGPRRRSIPAAVKSHQFRGSNAARRNIPLNPHNMVIKNYSGPKSAATQATRLAAPIQVRSGALDSFGSVATNRGFSTQTNRMPTSFTVVLDNSAGLVPVVYVIGDPDGMVAGKTGVVYTQPTRAQGTSVAAIRNSLRSAGLMISGINYNTLTGPAQFSQNFQFASADFDQLAISDIFSNEAERNTAQNPNLLTIQFKEQYELDWNSAFLVTADVAEVVTLTFFIGAAANR